MLRTDPSRQIPAERSSQIDGRKQSFCITPNASKANGIEERDKGATRRDQQTSLTGAKTDRVHGIISTTVQLSHAQVVGWFPISVLYGIQHYQQVIFDFAEQFPLKVSQHRYVGIYLYLLTFEILKTYIH